MPDTAVKRTCIRCCAVVRSASFDPLAGRRLMRPSRSIPLPPDLGLSPDDHRRVVERVRRQHRYLFYAPWPGAIVFLVAISVAQLFFGTKQWYFGLLMAAGLLLVTAAFLILRHLMLRQASYRALRSIGIDVCLHCGHALRDLPIAGHLHCPECGKLRQSLRAAGMPEAGRP